ncbi:IS3 family transposase [Spiroplasma citri]
MYLSIFIFIINFRPQSKLKGLSPVEYRNLNP